jgi:hypothetical protein
MVDKPKGPPLPSDAAALDAAAVVTPADVAAIDAYARGLGSPLLRAMYDALPAEDDQP